MAAKRKPRKTRGNDRERAQEAKAAQTSAAPEVWDSVRSKYPPSVVEMADGLTDKALSFLDVMRLELLDYFRMDMLIAKYLAEPKGSTAVATLTSARLQSRKHLRHLVAAMGPSLSLNDLPVRLPEGVVFELPDDDNLGDEIVN